MNTVIKVYNFIFVSLILYYFAAWVILSVVVVASAVTLIEQPSIEQPVYIQNLQEMIFPNIGSISRFLSLFLACWIWYGILIIVRVQMSSRDKRKLKHLYWWRKLYLYKKNADIAVNRISTIVSHSAAQGKYARLLLVYIVIGICLSSLLCVFSSWEAGFLFMYCLLPVIVIYPSHLKHWFLKR